MKNNFLSSFLYRKKIFILCIVAIVVVVAFILLLPVDKLPKIGEKLHGFTVTQVSKEMLVDAPAITFTHDKSGGMVYYIAADNPERSFDISFRTPALDKTGVPHVFEHITISGSDKYPHPNLFFPVSSQTYNTFVNAMTGNTYTTYPLASMSEEQLLVLADYYLDGVFHPLLYNDKRLVNREAWRYQLNDKNEPLALTGTVYNEMQGAITIDWAATNNVLDALFPGSTLANYSGGVPEFIPDLTWETLIEFHKNYYHPSNALVVLYGDMDYARFLEKIDGYFSEFDKADIKIDFGETSLVKTLQDKTYHYPVEASSSGQDTSIVDYSVVPQNVTLTDRYGLNLLTELLRHDSSLLMERLREAFPKATITTLYDMGLPMPVISFTGKSMNEADKDKLYVAVNETLAEIVSKGFDSDAVDAIISNNRFFTYTMGEEANIGVNYSMAIAMNWSMHGNTSYFNDYLTAIETIQQQSSEGYFEKLIEKYLLNNTHAAVTATVSVPGKAEENAAKLAAEFAGIKAGMSDSELDALIALTAELEAWTTELPPAELIDMVKVVDVKGLPEEFPQYKIQKTAEGGVEIYTALSAGSKIGSTKVLIDSSHIAQDDLHYYKFYTQILGRVAAGEYGREELATLITRYLNNFHTIAGYVELPDKAYKHVLSANWLSLNDEYAQTAKLVNSILFKSDVADITTLQSVLSESKNNLRTDFTNSTYSKQTWRAFASHYSRYTYYDYLNGVEYYKFLVELEQLLESEPQAVVERLKAVQASLADKTDATVFFAGSDAGIKGMKSSVSGVFEGLSADKKPVIKYDLPRPATREGIIVDSSLQYNMLYAPLDTLGAEYSGKLYPLILLVNDKYLTPQIRHVIGAYGAISEASEDSIYMISYRDPGISETYDVYAKIGDFLRGADLTQEDVDAFIINSYSTYALPEGELGEAMNAMLMKYGGRADDYKLKILREMKTLTLGDVRAYADMFDMLYEKGFTSTAGGAAAINGNSEFFDNIINVNEIDSSISEWLTRGEAVSMLFDGAEDAVDTAISVGLIRGDANGYRLDEHMTRQEFAFLVATALELQKPDTVAINDIAQADEFARESVMAVVSYGLMLLDDGDFKPVEKLSRVDFHGFMDAYIEMAS